MNKTLPEAGDEKGGGNGSGKDAQPVPIIPQAKRVGSLHSVALDTAQVKLQSDQQRRGVVTAILCGAAFMDIAGAVILQPAIPMMMSNAKQATKPASWPANYTHPQAFSQDKFNGIPYPFAINSVLVMNQFGGTISNVAMGAASDKFGRKNVIMVGVGMGSVTLVLYYVAGVVMKSFWAYLAFAFINGLFGGSKTVVMAYLKDIWGKDFMKIQPIIMLSFLMGGAAGGIIGGMTSSLAKVDDTSGNLFLGALVGAGMSFVLFLLVWVKVPEPPNFGSHAAAAKPKVQVPMMVKRILYTIVIAGAFDCFGDQGNTFARNTIFSNRYPDGKEVSINMAMILIKCFGVMIAMFIVMGSMKKIGLPLWCILGNLASAVAQFAIIPNSMPFGGFIAIWSATQVFGFTSTLASAFLLPRFAPPDSMGFWMGLQGSSTTLGMTLAPLMLSAIYSGMAPADGSALSEYADAECACLLTCGIISMMAVMLFFPLPKMIPKDRGVKPIDDKSMVEYEQMTDKEWSRLTCDVRNRVNEKRQQEDKPLLLAHWSTYQDDRDESDIEALQERSLSELQEIKRRITVMLVDRSKLEALTVNNKKDREDREARYDMPKERAAMGSWFADYLDDAGYHQWIQYPDVFKSMFMNAFPPIDELDGAKFNFSEVAELEIYFLSWLRTLDMHIRQQQPAGAMFGIKNISSLFTRGSQ